MFERVIYSQNGGSAGNFQEDGYDVEGDQHIWIDGEVHLPMERTENTIMISCDLEVICSLGLLGWAERVSNPSTSTHQYISSGSASSLGLRLRLR